MSAGSDDHSIAKIRTFRADVERARSEGATAVSANPVPQKAVKVLHTPSSTMRAERTHMVRDAQAYLELESETAPNTVAASANSKRVEEVKQEPKRVPKPVKLETPAVLNAEIESLSAASKKPSILSDSERVFEEDEMEEGTSGTIIKDYKKRRGFFASLKATLNRAFAARARTRVKSEATTSAVPPAPAVSTPHEEAPKDDFAELVRERVRAAQTPSPEPLTVVDENLEQGDVSKWTYLSDNAEVGQRHSETIPEIVNTVPELQSTAASPEATALSGGPLWQASRSTSARVAVSKPVAQSSLSRTEQPRIPVMNVVVTPRQRTPLPTREAPVFVAEPPHVQDVPPPVPQTQAEVPAPAEPVALASEPVEVAHAATVAAPRSDETMPTAEAYMDRADAAKREQLHSGLRSPSGFRRLEIREGIRAAQNAPTNSLAVILMIIIAAITFGVFVSMKLLTTTVAPNSSLNISQPPASIVVSKQLPLSLTTDRTDLLMGIHSLLEREQDTIQIYPTALTMSGREGAADAATILEVFDPRVESSFERAITEITFGGSGVAEPFIVLKTTDFDTSFAGMLAWESAMSTDLAPLFGEPVTETLDQQARTASSVREAFFVDSIIANRSARILNDQLGMERLVYVFVDQHTILITTNRTSVERLVPIIR